MPRTRAPMSRLSLMMFLQYAVWGAWLPIIGRYLGAHLGFSGGEIGWIVGTAGAVGGLLAPFVAGQLADRWFSAERFMFLSMIAGGVVQYILAGQTSYSAWIGLSILYSVIYMPTIAISNSLAFSHLRDPEKQFPPIRVWGTIGWIVVSWVFPMVWLQTGVTFQTMPPFLAGIERTDVLERLSDAMRLSAVISVIYGLYCLSLPHTPPKKSVEKIAVAKAFGLLRNRGLLVVTLVALPIAVIHTIYFIQTPQFLPTLSGVRDADIQPAMSIGQFSEIFVLGALGMFIKRFGFRVLMTVGCLAYFGRFAAFALGSPTWLVVSSQVLHGVCFACFYATAFIYVERVAPADVRHSAQTVFAIVLLGLGPLLAGPLLTRLSTYAERSVAVSECVETVNLIPKAPADGWDQLYEGANADVEAYRTANPDDQAGAWRALKPDTQVTALDYRKFWMVIAGIGLAGAVLLALLFRLDPPAPDEKPVPE